MSCLQVLYYNPSLLSFHHTLSQFPSFLYFTICLLNNIKNIFQPNFHYFLNFQKYGIIYFEYRNIRRLFMSLLNRSDVPVEETWNLEDLFATEKAYTAAIEEVRILVEETAAKLAGTITDVQGAINAIEATEKIQEKMVVIGTYASLSHSVDQTSTENQMRAASFGSFAAKLATKLSFVKSDLLALDEAVLKEAQNAKPEYANFINKLLVQKPHQLHPEAEKALA